MEFKKQLVTPSIAEQMLESNIRNRRIKKAVVSRYAQDMIAGRWKEDTGETVKISKSGIVLDGQHRLASIIKANVPINLHVVYGLDDSVFDVLDTGATRNATDTFYIEKINNDSTLPGIIQIYHMLKNPLIKHLTGGDKNYRLTNQELKSAYYERELFWQGTTNYSSVWYRSFAKILPPSLIGGFYAFFHDFNENDAYQFMDQLCTGKNINNNTVALLRNKLMQDKMSQKNIKANIKQALIIKTWNAFRMNEQFKILKFDTTKEEFPKAI